YFERVLPELQSPKDFNGTRTAFLLADSMVTISAAQELRKAIHERKLNLIIDAAIERIEKYLMQAAFSATLEMVDADGNLIDSCEGRTILPGHCFETAWFILEEARIRNNNEKLLKTATTILDWTLERSWDTKFGGLKQVIDCKGLESTDITHEMKFWWTHNEAEIAALVAYLLTKEEKYHEWHHKIHSWAFEHFADQKYGEWFGFLNRDGSVACNIKGNIWKGAFHLPRMLIYSFERLDDAIKTFNE
ncbi:MAG: AGE family epimerase/isomerase, partial [Thermoguttaceae bacterium]